MKKLDWAYTYLFNRKQYEAEFGGMGDQWVPQMWAAAAPLLPVATFAGAPPQIPGGADYVKLEKPDAPGEYGTGDGSYDAGGGHMPYPHADPTQAFFAPMYGAQAVLAPPVCSEQLANQKEAIYAHPFFPLLTCLFEKCELATCTPRDSSRDGGGGGCGINDVVSAESFKEDLAEFTRKLDGNKPYYAPNPELDSLMLQAITMLRFHLLELEKVHELCDNFCQRYVSCLKNKMPLDVGEDRASSSGNAPSPVPSSTASPNMNAPMNFAHYPPPQLAPPFEPQSVPLPESTSAMPQHSLESLQPSSSAYSQLTPLGVMATSSSASGHPLVLDGSVVAAATGHTSTTSSAAGPVPTPGSHGTSSSPATSSTGGLRNGGTPSMYECMNPNPASIESAETVLYHPRQHTTMEYEGASYTVLSSPWEAPARQEHHNLLHPEGSEVESSESVSPVPSSSSATTTAASSKRRGIFPKAATNVMRHWLFKHLTHPYPSEEQKKQLANDTGLTILQVNNWFINARRRIVQPMIDQSNRAGRGGAMCGGGISRSRRRDRDGDSDGGTPEAVGATAMNGGDSTPSIVASSYSPDPSAIVPQMTMPYMPNGMMPTFYPSFNPGAMAPGFLMPGMSMFSGPPWGMDPLSHNGD